MVIISQAVICQVTCANQGFFNKQESSDREKRNAHVRKWLFVAVQSIITQASMGRGDERIYAYYEKKHNNDKKHYYAAVVACCHKLLKQVYH